MFTPPTVRSTFIVHERHRRKTSSTFIYFSFPLFFPSLLQATTLFLALERLPSHSRGEKHFKTLLRKAKSRVKGPKVRRHSSFRSSRNWTIGGGGGGGSENRNFCHRSQCRESRVCREVLICPDAGQETGLFSGSNNCPTKIQDILFDIARPRERETRENTFIFLAAGGLKPFQRLQRERLAEEARR